MIFGGVDSSLELGSVSEVRNKRGNVFPLKSQDYLDARILFIIASSLTTWALLIG
jgi:hypothetical protein